MPSNENARIKTYKNKGRDVDVSEELSIKL